MMIKKQITITEEDLKTLEEIASKEERDVTAQIRYILKKFIAEYKEK